MMKRLSNMKAIVSPRYRGSRLAEHAASNVAASGPCGDMQLCRLAPPGTNPSAFASYSPKISPMYSFITLRWKYGGRNVSSATIQRGGKITKSQFAVPTISLGDVRTVKIDGSGWSKETVLMALKFARSYL